MLDNSTNTTTTEQQANLYSEEYPLGVAVYILILAIFGVVLPLLIKAKVIPRKVWQRVSILRSPQIPQ